jgi:hypothetical protein
MSVMKSHPPCVLFLFLDGVTAPTQALLAVGKKVVARVLPSPPSQRKTAVVRHGGWNGSETSIPSTVFRHARKSTNPHLLESVQDTHFRNFGFSNFVSHVDSFE